MTEVTRLWSVWQGLLSPFAWAFTRAGFRLESWKKYIPSSTFFQRTRK